MITILKSESFIPAEYFVIAKTNDLYIPNLYLYENTDSKDLIYSLNMFNANRFSERQLIRRIGNYLMYNIVFSEVYLYEIVEFVERSTFLPYPTHEKVLSESSCNMISYLLYVPADFVNPTVVNKIRKKFRQQIKQFYI